MLPIASLPATCASIDGCTPRALTQVEFPRYVGQFRASDVSADAPTDTVFSKTNEQLPNDGYATIPQMPVRGE